MENLVLLLKLLLRSLIVHCKDANKESAQLELQYLTLKNDIRKRGMIPEIEGKPKMSYVDALAKCEPNKTYKSVFV
jgi:hypothetical protein